MFMNSPRPILRMKKLILLSAVLLGTAVASQAGVHVDVGFGLPFPPIPLPGRVIISQPAPVYVERGPVCEPAPVYVEPRCEPAPRVVYVPQPRYYSYPSYRYGHSNWGHHDSHSSRGGHSDWDNH